MNTDKVPYRDYFNTEHYHSKREVYNDGGAVIWDDSIQQYSRLFHLDFFKDKKVSLYGKNVGFTRLFRSIAKCIMMDE